MTKTNKGHIHCPVNAWDCPYCDKKEIRGDTAVCPACGRPRGQVKFYMKGQAQNQERRADDVADIEYVDEEKAKYVNRNPDWYCSFCETLNSDNAETCRSCGAVYERYRMSAFLQHPERYRCGKCKSAFCRKDIQSVS